MELEEGGVNINCNSRPSTTSQSLPFFLYFHSSPASRELSTPTPYPTAAHKYIHIHTFQEKVMGA